MEKKNQILSDKDVLILQKLFEDGRKSSSSIATEIDLGREIVNYRIKRLIKENLIVKFVPKMNEKALNYTEYNILLKLNLEDEVSKEKFVKEQIGNKYLVWMIKSDSGWDLIVRLYAQSIEEFKAKLAEILEGYSSVLAGYYTIITSEEVKENEKELLFEELFNKHLPKKDFHVVKQSEPLSIDDKDKQIIKLLENDARVQYQEIAEELEISSDTVKYRIDKMKEHGVIENIVPVINFSKLGYLYYAAIMKLNCVSREDEKRICQYFLNHSCVIKAIKNLNADEYFLNLVFSNDSEKSSFEKELQLIVKNKVQSLELFKIE
jgi:DNA-binding Lrp family transcriptional regulator